MRLLLLTHLRLVRNRRVHEQQRGADERALHEDVAHLEKAAQLNQLLDKCVGEHLTPIVPREQMISRVSRLISRDLSRSRTLRRCTYEETADSTSSSSVIVRSSDVSGTCASRPSASWHPSTRKPISVVVVVESRK